MAGSYQFIHAWPHRLQSGPLTLLGSMAGSYQFIHAWPHRLQETEKLFATGKSKRLPPDIIPRAIMRLTQLDNAREVADLLLPPSNRLEALSGNRSGQWSIRINEQWRICFTFANGEATAVEITDYH